MAEPFGNISTAATASGTSVLAAPAGGFNPLAHAAMHASVGSGMDEDEDDSTAAAAAAVGASAVYVTAHLSGVDVFSSLHDSDGKLVTRVQTFCSYAMQSSSRFLRFNRAPARCMHVCVPLDGL